MPPVGKTHLAGMAHHCTSQKGPVLMSVPFSLAAFI